MIEYWLILLMVFFLKNMNKLSIFSYANISYKFLFPYLLSNMGGAKGGLGALAPTFCLVSIFKILHSFSLSPPLSNWWRCPWVRILVLTDHSTVALECTDYTGQQIFCHNYCLRLSLCRFICWIRYLQNKTTDSKTEVATKKNWDISITVIEKLCFKIHDQQEELNTNNFEWYLLHNSHWTG